MTELLPVTVVIPAHNALPDALEAVASALDQTLPPAEIVVVDDRSTDGTGEAIEARFGSSGLVRVTRGRFGSAAAARNAGWRAARTPWIAFLDADDLWYQNKLATAAAMLDAVPEAGWFFSDGAFRALDGTLHASWLEKWAELPEPWAGHPVAELFQVNFVLTSSVVVRRDLLEELGGFDERLSHAEDLDLWIRLARRVAGTASRRSLVRYQHRPGGLTRQAIAQLQGDVTLFQRLAQDHGLSHELKRGARRRESMAHYKLAVLALSRGEGAAARRHLRDAWAFPERRLAVIGAWATSWLPASWVGWLRTQRWATRGLARPTLSAPRVRLRTESALLAADIDSRARALRGGS